MKMSRRTLLGALAALGVAGPGFGRPGANPGPLAPSAVKPVPFSLDALKEQAARLAAQPYKPAPLVPKAWREINYDQYRSIWFNSQKALWNQTSRPFRLDLFAPGLYFQQPVDIHIVEDGVSRTLAFDLGLFDKTDQFPALPVTDTLGYSGLRLRAELESLDIFQEFMVFQGASYFRAIATGQSYGLSARGLALNTADDDGEEFPTFTRFWVETPAPGARDITVHALLDGPSTTGIYSFDILPGATTEIAVRATLYPRTDLEHVGLAPLTSMFLFDQTNRQRFNDFRPAVHDSEGLLIWNGNGEMLWRPLANPEQLQVSSFVDENPRGFGLMQRARRVDDFADFEANYQRRPSLWIEPGEDWGKGAVTLVEIPADREIYDNIVAYWRPRERLPSGAPLEFSYRMRWGGEPGGLRDVARIVNTRIGKGFDRKRVVVAIDFADHPSLSGNLEAVVPHVSSNRGPVAKPVLERNPGTGGLRLAFSFQPEPDIAVEFRAQLIRDDQALSEVWLYRWTG